MRSTRCRFPRGRVEYFDALSGFAVRIFTTGLRVFTLLYRMKGGRAKKYGVFGTNVIEVFAIDAAGNRSEPATIVTEI